MREMRVSCLRARLPALLIEDEVVELVAVVAGREAAATLARIVVRFLPVVGACGLRQIMVFGVQKCRVPF
jgi:hypothetical protein